MDEHEEAQELLAEMCASIPMPFFYKLESTQRGFRFVLTYLRYADREVLAGDLAKTMKVSTARIAALLNKMEHGGLIKRHTSAKDARRTVVELTEAGVKNADEIKLRAINGVENLIKKVGREDLETFIHLSREIGAAVEESHS